MRPLKYIFDQLKRGDLVCQQTPYLYDLSEYLGNSRFIRIAISKPAGLVEWTYPLYGHLQSKIVSKKDLVLYTHWPLKSKRFFDLLEESLK